MKAILCITMALATLTSSKKAEACGSGGEEVLLGAAILALDTGLLVKDLGYAAADKRASRGYGVFEFVVMTPQALVLTVLAAEISSPAVFVLAGLTGGMAAHGLYVATRPRQSGSKDEKKSPKPSSVGRSRVRTTEFRFSPTLVTTGKDITPGIGLGGRF